MVLVFRLNIYIAFYQLFNETNLDFSKNGIIHFCALRSARQNVISQETNASASVLIQGFTFLILFNWN